MIKVKNADAALLDAVYRSAAGARSAARRLALSASEPLKDMLEGHAGRLRQIEAEAAEGLIRAGENPKRFAAAGELEGELECGGLPSDIADAMIRTNAENVAAVREKLAQGEVSELQRRLAARLIHEEKKNIDRMRAFLG